MRITLWVFPVGASYFILIYCNHQTVSPSVCMRHASAPVAGHKTEQRRGDGTRHRPVVPHVRRVFGACPLLPAVTVAPGTAAVVEVKEQKVGSIAYFDRSNGRLVDST